MFALMRKEFTSRSLRYHGKYSSRDRARSESFSVVIPAAFTRAFSPRVRRCLLLLARSCKTMKQTNKQNMEKRFVHARTQLCNFYGVLVSSLSLSLSLSPSPPPPLPPLLSPAPRKASLSRASALRVHGSFRFGGKLLENSSTPFVDFSVNGSRFGEHSVHHLRISEQSPRAI